MNRVKEEFTFTRRKLARLFLPKTNKVEFHETVRTDYFWAYKEPGVHTWTEAEQKQFRKTKKARVEEDKKELGEEVGGGSRRGGG